MTELDKYQLEKLNAKNVLKALNKDNPWFINKVDFFGQGIYWQDWLYEFACEEIKFRKNSNGYKNYFTNNEDFIKQERTKMTSKLREQIKERDNYTCQNCGNSIYLEPNLLLEIDHIIPVSMGGLTTEDNLQTLCWRCNRKKSNKTIF